MGRHVKETEKKSGGYRVVKFFTVVLSVILAILLIGGGAIAIGVYRLLHNMQEGPTTTLTYEEQQSLIAQMEAEDQATAEDLEGLEVVEEHELEHHTGVAQVEQEVEKGVYNFLLLGLDTRDDEYLENSRTDVNIIVTLDTEQGIIRLTSLMRDILLPIEGYGQNRINTINRFLGADATVEYVEKYTGIPLLGYVKVNFSCVASVVNILGGVDMQLSSAEVNTINDYLYLLNELDTLNPDEDKLVNNGDGVYHLGGKQAVSYMRIRKNMGGEFGRNERQRKLLTEVVHEMSDITMDEALSLVNAIMMYTRTDLSKAEIIQAATMLFNLRNSSIEQMSMPSQDKYSSARCKGMYVLVVDFDEQAERVQRFILQDLPPDPVSGE